MATISIATSKRIKKTREKTINKDTLSYRLAYALAALKISQSELARRLSIKPQSIQYICANNVIKSQFSFQIATALDISYTWLTTGQGCMIENSHENENHLKENYRTPILTEHQFLSYINNDFVISEQTVDSWFVTNMATSNASIALIANNDAMNPPFPKEATLIFDTSAKPKNFDFVAAHINQSHTVVFRQLFVNETEMILKPTDKMLYKDITLTKQDAIIAVLTQTHYSLHNGQ